MNDHQLAEQNVLAGKVLGLFLEAIEEIILVLNIHANDKIIEIKFL